MTCPRCGYARADFDTYCLRCRLMDAQGVRPPVSLADQTIVMSDLPGPTLLSQPPPRRSRLWLPLLLVLLAFVVGGVLWHFVAASHSHPHLSVDAVSRVSS